MGEKEDKVKNHITKGWKYYSNGDYEKAEKEYREAIRINPNLAVAHNKLGELLVDLRRYDEAEKELKEAIRINLNDVVAPNNLFYVALNNLFYLSLAVLLQKLQQYEGAKKKYKKANNAKKNKKG